MASIGSILVYAITGKNEKPQAQAKEEPKSMDDIKSTNDFCNEMFSDQEHNKILKKWFGESNFNRLKLSVQLKQLAAQDNRINEILEEEIDEIADYALEIEDLNEEIAKLNQEEDDEYNKNLDRYLELSNKSEKNELTASEESEFREVTRYVFNYNGNDYENKRNDIKSGINSVNGKISSLKIQNHVDKASGYVDKTNDVAKELKQNNNEIKTDYAEKAADKLNDTVQEISGYKKVYEK